MAEQISFQASRRVVIGKQVRQLRRDGFLPAVIYGHATEPVPIQLNAREVWRTLATVGGASLLALHLDGKETHNVLVREIQRDALSRKMLHVDFYEVRMDEEIHVSIPVRLTGVAPAVREADGVLVQGLDEVDIECLPGDLITHVNVDLGNLRKIGDNILVKDLVVPEKVKILTSPDEMVAVVTHQAAEEKVEEVPVSAEVEVLEKGKKEEEEEEE